MKSRIVLADDHKIMRNGLRSLIEKELEIEVIGEAENGRDAVRIATGLTPDMIIMDIAMPGLNGIEATRQIIASVPGIKVIALSMHTDNWYITEMLKAGACGYVLKDNAFEELVNAIRAATENRIFLSPQISEVVISDYVLQLKNGNNSAFAVLSDREREVLQLLAEGNSTPRIAELLHVSTKTIETHRQHIMNKLNIHSIAELTKYAIRQGLTSV